MRKHVIHKTQNNQRSIMVLPVIFLVLLFTFNNCYGGDSEFSDQDDPINTRMNLTVTQQEGDTYLLESLVRARIEGRYTGISDLKVNFFTFNSEDEQEIGSVITDSEGIASFTVDGSKLLFDTSMMTGFIAFFDGNDSYGDSDDEVEIIKAEMTIETSEDEDEEGNISRTVDVTLTSKGEPVEEAYVYLSVNSMLRPLPIGEEETDEYGMASFDFPTDLPGSKEGQLQIIAKIDDNDDYGNVKSSLINDWGIKRMEEDPGVKRSLSSPNPPLWLLITFLGLLIIIWGHYIEVIVRMFKLKKIAD